MLNLDEVISILEPQFGFLGKSVQGEPLWVHSFTVWSISSKLLSFIPRFNERERRLLEITCLIHDIGKMSKTNQAKLSGASSGKVKHTLTRDQINSFFRENNLLTKLSISDKDIDFIYHAHLHHHLSDEALKTAPPALAVYADIVRYADWLASSQRLDTKLINRLTKHFEPFCQITSVSISRLEGPANYLLFDIAYNLYNQYGWDVLLILSDGLILIASKGTPYPNKSEVVEKFQDRIIRDSLKLQQPNPTNFAAVLLGGESAKNPSVYLDVHKELLLDALSDFDRAPLFFFKLLIEIFDNSGILNQSLKDKYPILDILKGLCGTRGIPIARRKWQQMGGQTLEPLKEMLKEIFGKISLEDIIPSDIIDLNNVDKIPLTELSPDRLYKILYQLSSKLFSQQADNKLTQALESLISMEEEIDFRTLAMNRFIQYKRYKETHNPEKGICETCGFTIAFSTQKSLNFPADKCWGFSQISAHTDSARATCTLCTYDTMILRRDIKNRVPVYIRIESKTRELWSLYKEISDLIQKLNASFANPYTLETLEKREDIGFLPVPKQFKLPRIREPKSISIPVKSVRGYLIPVDRVDIGASPKDLRAKYMSLYALLLMMGFNVHIGFEEQNGLFGDKTIAKHGETYETLYYRGLAIKWLANLLGGDRKEKQNAHVFAEALLTKSPSVAITKIGEAATDEKKKKITQEQVSCIIETIIKGGFKIRATMNGGAYSMKELLKDAMFFAEGVPAFIWSGEDHKAWRSNASKHLITKSISKTMNCILQGDDFETAFAKFLSFIKEDISGDKTREDSRAKVDVTDLKVFVERARDVFKRYYELRQHDISAFIQAKNALLSSIYLLKRYPNIKEVVNG